MPEECSRADFRDPKVWKDEDGRYYMLAGNRTYDGIPQVVLFSSDDMYNWKFESVFAKDEIHETNVSYTPGTQMLEIDRTFAGWIRDTNCVRKVKIKNGNGLSKMRIVMDWNSIEIFVNDGEQVLSTVIYTPRNAQDIVFETDGCVELEVEKYDLNI